MTEVNEARPGGASSLVEVYAADNLIEADAVCAMLHEAGVLGESVGPMVGAIPFSHTGPQVWTTAEDAPPVRR